MMRLNKKVLAHFEHPQNVGRFDSHIKGVGTALMGSYERGIVIQIQLRIEDQVIEEARFKAYGCSATIAACSLLTTSIQGKSLEEALHFTGQQLIDELELPALKVYSAMLAEDVLQAAIQNYINNNP